MIHPVRQFLKLMTQARYTFKLTLGKAYRYNCLEEFVLKQGRSYKPATSPSRYRTGIPGYCFHNAQILAKRHKLVYVEGFAAGIIPVLHAWCVQPGDTTVIDLTWRDGIGTAYFGVPFSADYVNSHLSKEHDTASLIDYYRAGWPLLKRGTKDFKWQKEKPD